MARVKGAHNMEEGQGTRIVSRNCCVLSRGRVRRQDGHGRVKVQHIAGRAAAEAPHVGPC